MKKLLLAAALAAAALSPAWAEQEYAQARTLGFGYDLIDLNNMDGITPTISFRYEGVAGQSYSIAQGGLPGLDGDHHGYGTLDHSARGARVELLSAADRTEAYATSSPDVVASGRSTAGIAFSLTPWTAVVFHLPYSLAANLVEPGSWLVAQVELSGRLDAANGLADFAVARDLRTDGTQSGSLTAQLATGRNGSFGTVFLETYAAVSVVPEPAPYAMLLAGLGVVAVWRRRQHRWQDR